MSPLLIAWNSEIGLRGLLPILPLYFFYGAEGVDSDFLGGEVTCSIHRIGERSSDPRGELRWRN